MRKQEQERDSLELSREKSRHPAPTDMQKRAAHLQNSIIDLQRSAGNQAVEKIIKAGAIHPKLRVSQPGDADEHEADHVAEQVVSALPAKLHRKRSCPGGAASCPVCEEEEVEQSKGIHRKTEPSSDGGESVSADFVQSLGPGQPMDPSVRENMESGFGEDFGNIKIHADDAAASSAKSIQARAFTTGQHIVFGEGEYAPYSSSGSRLLAHELTHTVQNRGSSARQSKMAAPAAAVKRQSLFGQASAFFSEKTGKAGKWIDEKKWEIYRAMIAGLKSQKAVAIGLMRALIPKLPSGFQSAASTIIDVVDFFVDLEIALLLAIIGLAVGFVEGIVGLVVGLIKLALGFLKMAVDYLVSLMGRPDEYQQDVSDLAKAIMAIPPGLKKIKDQWLERYQHATLEEQVLMGGELVGEIEAFIATFAFAGTKAGQATTLTARTGEFGQVVVKGGIGALERAPAISITIPAVVPKTAAEAAVVSSQMMVASGQGPGPGTPGKASPRARDKSAADRFLRAQLAKIKDPKHPLHFLVEPKLNAEGKPLTSAKGDPLLDWRKTTRTTESGGVQTGRYQANESGVTIQVGHQTAFTSGAPEQFTLEDADLNQLSGQTVESRGALSAKPAVEIEGVPVDLQSAEQWERLGLLEEGTVAKSFKIPAPDLSAPTPPAPDL